MVQLRIRPRYSRNRLKSCILYYDILTQVNCFPLQKLEGTKNYTAQVNNTRQHKMFEKT